MRPRANNTLQDILLPLERNARQGRAVAARTDHAAFAQQMVGRAAIEGSGNET